MERLFDGMYYFSEVMMVVVLAAILIMVVALVWTGVIDGMRNLFKIKR